MDEPTRQLQAARERETATREILRVISRSPGDYEPVFQTVLDNAIRLCRAPFGALLLAQGEVLDVVADTGLGLEFLEFIHTHPFRLDDAGSILARAVHERAPQQRATSDEETYRSGRPRRIAALELTGIRTLLGVPIIIGEEAIGVIALWRKEVKPFADDDIELVSTFADQAAIAIENVRQFQALEARTADLTKTLEQQTASSDILRSINHSRADFNPVFQTILSHAVRLCGAPFGGLFLLRDGQLHVVAHVGWRSEVLEKVQANPPALDLPHNLLSQAARAREPRQIVDVLNEVNPPRESRRASTEDEQSSRTLLAVPILQGDELLGVIGLFRREVKAFADDEIELVRTFADQAAIAIENVHQLQAVQSRTADLTKSLERQTATSDILRSISQSLTDYAPIFDTILENAIRLCGAPFGTLFLLRDGHLHVVADAGSEPAMVEHFRTHPMPLDETSAVLVRAVISRAPVQQDLMDEAYHAGDPRRLVAVDRFGARTWLGVPLLKRGEVIGAIALYRKVAVPFADEDVALVSTFADQAVIAIENVRLFQALETRTTDLTQSLERQTATSEILRSISQSPTDYDPVFDTILENATRLCGAPFGILFLLRDDHLHLVADVGARPEYVEYLIANPLALNNTVAATSNAAREREPRQLTVLSAAAARSGNPMLIASVELEGIRTVCAVPMLKGAETVGVIALYRREIEAFTNDDIALVSTFTDQAVIAIENVRLFQALESRNSALGESLERQTATSEILRTISRSPTDYQPVFETILESATRLCDAPLGQLYLVREGGVHLVAHRGSRPEFLEFSRNNVRPANRTSGNLGKALAERRAIHSGDPRQASLYSDGDKWRVAAVELEGIRAGITVPLLKGEESIGAMVLYRREVRPFEDRHVSLVETFADQAVIAIENVRLFQALEGRTTELTKTLERQTATSEILRSISQSPTDYAPVFQTILENAIRLCGAPFGMLFLLRDGHLHVVADVGARPEIIAYLRDNPWPLDHPSAVLSQAARERVPSQNSDMMDEIYRSGDPIRAAAVELGGVRTLLGVPMLKGSETVGVIALYRQEVNTFEDDDIELVATFADQAVIAIENVRLFQALEGRTTELTKTLERQTATSEILRSISQSPTGYDPVFDTILENASRLCDVQFSGLFLLRDNHLHLDASLGGHEEFVDFYRTNSIPVDSPTSLTALCARERIVQHDVDVRNSERYRSGETLHVAPAELGGIRTMLMVPLFRDEQTLGVIGLFRQQLRAFEDDEIELVRTFADQAVIAIENVNLFNETNDALERQTASADILKVISDSPTDVQPVFDAIAESARKLCGALISGVFRFDGEQIQFVAQHGWTPETLEAFQQAYPRTPAEDKLIGRALLERRVVNVADVLAEFRAPVGQVEMRYRSVLAVPLLREGVAIGAITVARASSGLFPDQQVDLVTTFAGQAVIAIENVRLFQALEGRTADLSKTLERQTATSEILRSISQSPTDYTPVFQTILDNAIRLCGAPFGMMFLRRDGYLHLVADANSQPEFREHMQNNPWPVDRPSAVLSTAVREGVPKQRADQMDGTYSSGDPLRAAAVELGGVRTLLGVPMLKGDEAIGVIALYRQEVKTFDDDEIELVTTFADQAVIAIENVRMFQALEGRTTELSKTLERQTATSEILRSISRSPTDYAPVFDTILENAIRLCGAPFGILYLLRGDHLHVVADAGSRPEFIEHLRANPRSLIDHPEGALPRAALDGVPCQVEDLMKEGYETAHSSRVAAVEIGGIRTIITVPMRKGDVTLGLIVLYREEVKRFADDDIELVNTFADQAVIAIENVRLFQTLEARTADLSQTLERQTATSEILRSISRSPTDYTPVFDTILENATRLCEASLGLLLLRKDDHLEVVATMGGQPAFVEFCATYQHPIDEHTVVGRSVLEKKPVQVEDTHAALKTSTGPLPASRVAMIELEGARTLLCIPMLRDEQVIGVIGIYRREVRLFDDSSIELLGTFADQAVIAIENVRLFQTLEARTADLSKTLERQTATSEILRSISRSPTDYAPVFDTILDNAARLCEAPLGLLFLHRNGHLENVASIGAQPAYIEFLATCQVPIDEQTAIGQAALHKRAAQIEDTQEALLTDSSSPGRIATVELEGARTFLAVPMLRDEQVVGVIAIYRREVRRFDDSMVELLETFADQAVIAIENVRLFQTVESRSSELAQSVAELEALGDIAQAVSSSLDVDTVLDTIVTRAVQLSRADAGAINEFDEATGTLPFRAAPGMEHMLEQPAPRLGEGAVGRAAATRAPVQIADITVPGAYTGPLTGSLSDLRIRALLAVPMMQNDHVLGTLVVARRTPGKFPPEAERLLRALGTQSAIAIRNARLFREIEDKGRELEAANRHKSEFLANMSHELRTPLNAVIGFSEVLGERMFGELNDKQSEYVTDIHDSGRHLLSLINDILDLSKVEAGAMELDLGRFMLAPALDNALTLVRERAERRGIVLQAPLADDLGEMEGDERKLKQILLNLLSNAIKFTGEGGSVTLEARQDEAHVHIAVRDTGVGISEEDLAVIFEEFKQVGTDYARKVEGTGLGLTLTKRFIEMHGGHITVTSEPGTGSVFTAVLPLRPVEQET
ncbi:MAG: GAF domain-containing protein/anti-sigma regulatory factor (Ser/Thr protein kinase) [Gammaproteobacteria bacterium]